MLKLHDNRVTTDVAEDLVAACASSFGPLPREKLLLTATRKAVLTCSGTSILGALVSRHPIQALVLSAAAEHVQASGDGAKSFVLMLDAALREVERQLLTRPSAHQAAWQMRLSRATCWLQQVLVLLKTKWMFSCTCCT